MDRVALVGWTVLVLALVGYAIGVLAPYPGRSVTLPGLMAGIALAAIGSGGGSGSDAGSGGGPESDSEIGSGSDSDPGPDAAGSEGP